jgi:hypothetical protein
VLRGATEALGAFSLVEVKLSMAPVYVGGPLFVDVFGFLRAQGFAPIAFEGVLDDEETGEMLQADGIFGRGTISSLDNETYSD